MPLSRMLGLEPHHDGSELYVPNQRSSLGDRIEVFARVHRSDPVTAAAVRHLADGEPRYAEATIAGEAGGWVWWPTRPTVRRPRPRRRYGTVDCDGIAIDDDALTFVRS